MERFYTPEDVRRRLRYRRFLFFLLFLLTACGAAFVVLELLNRLAAR